MENDHRIPHSFNLRGLPAGKSFFGCKRCWHMEVDSYCPYCPKCSKPGLSAPMGYFTVTQEDVALCSSLTAHDLARKLLAGPDIIVLVGPEEAIAPLSVIEEVTAPRMHPQHFILIS